MHDNTIQIAMPQPIARNGELPRSSSKLQAFQGRTYKCESESYYQSRVSCAEAHKANGVPHGLAWYRAFQEFPREYVDGPEPSSASSLDDATLGNTSV